MPIRFLALELAIKTMLQRLDARSLLEAATIIHPARNTRQDRLERIPRVVQLALRQQGHTPPTWRTKLIPAWTAT